MELALEVQDRDGVGPPGARHRRGSEGPDLIAVVTKRSAERTERLSKRHRFKPNGFGHVATSWRSSGIRT